MQPSRVLHSVAAMCIIKPPYQVLHCRLSLHSYISVALTTAKLNNQSINQQSFILPFFLLLNVPHTIVFTARAQSELRSKICELTEKFSASAMDMERSVRETVMQETAAERIREIAAMQKKVSTWPPFFSVLFYFVLLFVRIDKCTATRSFMSCATTTHWNMSYPNPYTLNSRLLFHILS